jgi:hypothetical protein
VTFDPSTVSAYQITAYNVKQHVYGQVLQATLYLASVTAVPTSVGAPFGRGAWYELPGIVGSARAQFALQAQPGPSSFSTVADFTTPGNNNWTAPSGLTKIDKTECWAGGGGGAGSNTSAKNGGGGGGAGQYSREDNIPVTGLATYVARVGGGGPHGGVNQGGNSGGDSYLTGDSGFGARAYHGIGGWTSGGLWGGGKGGAGSTDPYHFGGGDGYQSNYYNQQRGGGGGAPGGPNGPGGDASDRPGAGNNAGSGPGGDGGYSGSGQTPHTGSSPAWGYGGGGGGGAWVPGDNGYAGADGAPGRVKLTYGATGLLPLSSFLAHMPGRGAPAALNPYCPVGAGADIPNGSIEYTVPAPFSLGIPATFDGSYTLYLVASSFTGTTSPHQVTVTIRQYPYAGGTPVSTSLTRTFTPSTDINNGYVDMGPVTLPVQDIPPGNLQAYFTIAVTEASWTGSRYLDALLLDVTGTTLLVNVPGGTSILNNIWVDAPDTNRAVGGIFGSNGDRDQAFSVATMIERMSGTAFTVDPGEHNRLLIYSAQGNPAVTGWYTPRFWMDRNDAVVST